MRSATTIEVTKALADENRLRILDALRHGELCVCQIVELMELAPSTTSRHLSQLRRAGLILSRKSGRWIHYRLATDAPLREPEPTVTEALRWVLEAMDRDPARDADRARLPEILAEDVEAITARQRAACCRPTREGAER